MGDLDFEELDKAVNNLMGKASSMKSDDPAPTTISINSTLQPGEGPNHGMVQAVANGIGGDITDAQRSVMQDLQSTPLSDANSPAMPDTPAPVAFTGPVTPDPATYSSTLADSSVAIPPASPVASAPIVAPALVPDPIVEASAPPETPKPFVPRPSSGRFMDVVHPSSDMRSQPGPDLVVPTREEMSAPQPPSAPMSTPTPAQNVSSTDEPVVIAEPASTDDMPLVQDTQPLTPFLPDANAKVEKRPLGSTPESEKSSEPEEPEIAEISATPDVPVESTFAEPFMPVDGSSDGADESQPINGEFDRSVSKSEKGESQRLIDPTSVILPSASNDKELQSIESAEVEGADSKQDESEPAPVADTKQDAVRAVESGDTGHLSSGTSAGASNGAESSEDKTGDIFDVKNNHHPAIHPVKQRSGWLTIVIVVLVIVVCVGIAAAAYYILGLGV